jgi:hypothetical protein
MSLNPILCVNYKGNQKLNSKRKMADKCWLEPEGSYTNQQHVDW